MRISSFGDREESSSGSDELDGQDVESQEADTNADSDH